MAVGFGSILKACPDGDQNDETFETRIEKRNWKADSSDFRKLFEKDEME
jgi:hypothetical protein